MNNLFKQLEVENKLRVQIIDNDKEFGIKIIVPSILNKNEVTVITMTQDVENVKYRVQQLIDTINTNLSVFIDSTKYEIENMVAMYNEMIGIETNIVLNENYFIMN